MRKWRFRSRSRRQAPNSGYGRDIFAAVEPRGRALVTGLRRTTAAMAIQFIPHVHTIGGRRERRLSPISVAPAQHSASFMRDEGAATEFSLRRRGHSPLLMALGEQPARALPAIR